MKKLKKKWWKLMPIPANASRVEGNHFPLQKNTVMAKEKGAFLLLGSNKPVSSSALQTLFLVCKMRENVEIPTIDQQIMQYTKTKYKIYFYNTLRKLNRIEQDQENTYN